MYASLTTGISPLLSHTSARNATKTRGPKGRQLPPREPTAGGEPPQAPMATTAPATSASLKSWSSTTNTPRSTWRASWAPGFSPVPTCWLWRWASRPMPSSWRASVGAHEPARVPFSTSAWPPPTSSCSLRWPYVCTTISMATTGCLVKPPAVWSLPVSMATCTALCWHSCAWASCDTWL